MSFADTAWDLTRAAIMKEYKYMDEGERDLFSAAKAAAQVKGRPKSLKPARAGVYAVWTHRISEGMSDWDLHVANGFDIIGTTPQIKLF